MWYRCSGGGREQRANLLRRENRAAYYIIGTGVIVMRMRGLSRGDVHARPGGFGLCAGWTPSGIRRMTDATSHASV